MKLKFTLLMAAGLFLAVASQAQSKYDNKFDNMSAIHRDNKSLRHDKKEMYKDGSAFRHDRNKFRHDKRKRFRDRHHFKHNRRHFHHNRYSKF